MKKKLFTILTLLVLCVTGAWAGTEVIKAGTWSSDALYSGTCVYTSSISGAGDGKFSAGDGGGNIKNYSPSDKGIKLRTQRTTVKVSDTEYGIVLFSVRSGNKVNSITIEGTSNGSNTITLKGVYADVNTASLATSLAGATNILTTDKTYPSNSTTYITSGTLSVNAENNIVLLFNKDTDNQLRAIITFDYEENGVAAPIITQSSNTITISSTSASTSIYYTLDGTTPTSSSTAYSTPFDLTNSCTVRAIAIKDGEASDVTSKDCFMTADDALAVLVFDGGTADGTSWTDGAYTLTASTNNNIQEAASFATGKRAFKMNNGEAYTLSVPENVGITKIVVVGKTWLAGTSTMAITDFTGTGAFYETTLSDEVYTRYVGSYSFTPNSTLAYGTSAVLTPSGCQLGAYIEVYGTIRPIAVTGVTLNKTTAGIEVGETETLTATVTPANATNQNVTWESDDTDVATVSAAGVVTAVTAGTATITATSEDGSFTATCEVTVTAAATDVTAVSDYFWNFDEVFSGTSSVTTSGIVSGRNLEVNMSSGSITVSSGKKTFGGTDITKYLSMGKYSDKSNNIHVKVASMSKISVYCSGGSGRALTVALGSTSGDKLFNNESVSSSNATILTCEYVGAGDGDIYIYNSGSSNGLSVYGIKVEPISYSVNTATVDVDGEYYATFYSPYKCEITTDGVMAYIGELSNDNSTLTLHAYDGSVIPANTGVVLGATTSGSVSLVATSKAASSVSGTNSLSGTIEATTPKTASNTIYVLGQKDSNVGFYTYSGEISANKAYIEISGEGAPAIRFENDEENDATGIKSIESNNQTIKFFEDGQLLIKRDGITYDVMGRVIR